MALYCKLEDIKATLTYSFNKVKNTVVFKNAPIEVITKEIVQAGTFTGLQCPIPYVVSYRSINNNGPVGEVRQTGVTGPITSITTGHSPSGFSSPFESEWQIRIACQGGGESYANGVALIRVNYSAYGYGELISIEPQPPYLDNCGDPPRDKRQCEITVSAMGNILINDRGECPINYSVVCGEECPTGTTKCHSTNYPGYCCLPCEPTKQSIIGIKNIVKSVNKEAVSNG